MKTQECTIPKFTGNITVDMDWDKIPPEGHTQAM
jgi:hypothetical protein